MSFHVPEKYRLGPPHHMGTDETHGNNGAFVIDKKFPKDVRKHKGESARQLWCIASDGLGWEHVSVHVYIPTIERMYTPLWDEMCLVKSLFWDPEDVVVQFHPAESEYVNNHENVLHLWRQVGHEFPTPPSILVGVK